MGLTLREVRDEDLPPLFEQWAVPIAVHMAAFTAPDHMDWDAFERRWSRLRADETVLTKVVVDDAWGAETQPRAESWRFAGRSNKCTPRG
jgi:hypothetical protein